MAKKDLTVNIDSKTRGLEQGVSKSVNEVRKLEKQTRKSKNEFKKFDDRVGKLVSGNLGGLLSTMGSVAGVLGVAKLAQVGFTKSMRSSQETSDLFDKTMAQAKGGVDFFFQSIATGDFGNFLTGLDDAIRRGGELALVLDELGDRLAGWDDVSSEITMDIAENRVKIQDESTTPEERKKLIEEQEKLISRLKDTALIVNDKQEEAIRKTIQSIANINNVTMDEVTEYLQKTSLGINKELDDYINKVDKLKFKSTETEEYTTFSGDTITKASRKTTAAEKAENDLKILKEKNPLLERQYQISKLVMDLERQGVVTSRQQLRQRTVMIANMERTLLRDKRRNYGESGDGSGKGNNIISGSIADIDKQIKEVQDKLKNATTRELYKHWESELKKLEEQKLELTVQIKFDPVEGDIDSTINKYATSKSGKTWDDMPKVGDVALGATSIPTESISAMQVWNATMNKIREDNWATIESFNGISMAMGALGDSTEGSTAQMFQWAATTLSAIGQAIPAIMALTAVKEVEAQANAKVAVTGVASSLAGIPVVGGILAVAAIASVIAAMSSIPKFAEGGLVYGNTIAQVGEYAGASNNPEVIAPLSKLRDILSDTQQNNGVGGVVDFRIAGKELVGVINNYSSKQRKK